MSVLKLADKSNSIQLTPEDAFEEAIEVCRESKVEETIAIIVHGDGTFTWLQGGGQSNEHLLWNLTSLLEKLKKRWF